MIEHFGDDAGETDFIGVFLDERKIIHCLFEMNFFRFYFATFIKLPRIYFYFFSEN